MAPKANFSETYKHQIKVIEYWRYKRRDKGYNFLLEKSISQGRKISKIQIY